MTTTVLRSKGQLTIPADVREATHLEEGDPIKIEVVEGGILLRPCKVVDATQAWFWTPGWQKREREADGDRAAGRFERFESDEAFLGALDERT